MRQVKLTSSSNLELFETSEVRQTYLYPTSLNPSSTASFSEGHAALPPRGDIIASRETKVTAGSWHRWSLPAAPKTYFCKANYCTAIRLLVP